MGKRIIILCGSPRKNGNTNTLVGWVVAAARAEGAEVEVVDAAHLTYKANGCTACMACQKSDKYECVIDDEASPIIARIPQFDMLVLATPIYWMGPSAQLKLLLDRTFALVKFDPRTGQPLDNPTARNKGLCLIATSGGGPEEGLALTDETFKAGARFTSCWYDSLIMANAPHDPRQLGQNREWREKAETFGRRLARHA